MQDDENLSALERARRTLYSPSNASAESRAPLSVESKGAVPHAWEGSALPKVLPRRHSHMKLATIFFAVALLFFVGATGTAGYLFYYGGNTVSTNNVAIDIQGPTTIAGGDTVPLSFTITNKNSVTIGDAKIEVDFPPGTRSADDITKDYPRYTEDLGPIAPGAVITRSVKAVLFGGEGQSVDIPVSMSYTSPSSNAVFVKKTSYTVAISSAPLSVSVESLGESVSGKPFQLTLRVRSNAKVPTSNVVVSAALPTGFTLSSSSMPLQAGSFIIGTMQPGTSQIITIDGVLSGATAEQKVFHFTVGTAKDSSDPQLAVAYMTQDATVALTAPFITTTLALNGSVANQAVLNPGAAQSATISYANTLNIPITNAQIQVQLSGGAIDYNSVRVSNGFYDSSTRTVIFSSDNDSSLASLAPGASGIGTFTFNTLPSGSALRDTVLSFTTSVSGTRVGQSNVPEQVNASSVATAKVASAVTLAARSLHSSGPLPNTGPIPPMANTPTSYTVVWSINNPGNAVAGGVVTATLPTYVTYTGKNSGTGSISYNESSHTITWNVGDLAAGGSAQTAFQVSITPSTTQKGTAPTLTSTASFTGFDRFAQVQVTSRTDSVTTATTGDSDYNPNNASVQ